MFGIIAKNAICFKVYATNKKNYENAGSENKKLFKNNSTVASFFKVTVDIPENTSQFVFFADESLDIQKNK